MLRSLFSKSKIEAWMILYQLLQDKRNEKHHEHHSTILTNQPFVHPGTVSINTNSMWSNTCLVNPFITISVLYFVWFRNTKHCHHQYAEFLGLVMMHSLSKLLDKLNLFPVHHLHSWGSFWGLVTRLVRVPNDTCSLYSNQCFWHANWQLYKKLEDVFTSIKFQN